MGHIFSVLSNISIFGNRRILFHSQRIGGFGNTRYIYLKKRTNVMKSPKRYYVGTEDFLLASKNCFLYFFFLKLMWRFKRRKQIRRGYPVSFKQMFIGLPENITKIDAVYERPIDNCIIFFTGNFMLSAIRVLLTKSKKKKIFF